MIDEEERRVYEQGLHAGEFLALKRDVQQLALDVRILNKSVWLLYGAIAILQFAVPLFMKVL